MFGAFLVTTPWWGALFERLPFIKVSFVMIVTTVTVAATIFVSAFSEFTADSNSFDET